MRFMGLYDGALFITFPLRMLLFMVYIMMMLYDGLYDDDVI